MRARALKYLLVFSLPLTAAVAFTTYGWLTYLTLLYAFAVIPLLELVFPASKTNLNSVELEVVKKDRLYDVLLYLVVPIQWAMLVFFLISIQEELSTADLTGRILAMGILNGVFGINVAHELGHRASKYEQILAKALLCTSLYMHFFIEHNQGHHKNVATESDPASARKNEWLYTFWIRSVVMSYFGAWKIQMQILKRKKARFLSLQNEMLFYHIFQFGLISGIYMMFGWLGLSCFLTASLIGALLLETVNYIEHYGLRRLKVNERRYENVQPTHSWNSNHVIGRLLLFELSRHSDHHYQAAKPYQLLDHTANAPQMPTGYPGMMLLSLVPPIWMLVMNRKLSQLQEE